MSLDNMNIGRKLILAFASLIGLMAALTAIVIYNIGRLETADGWNSHTYVVLGKSGAMLDGMINQETGLRGFLVAGDDRFLEPYRAGQQQFAAAFGELKSLTADNPAQQQRLDKMKAFADGWRNDVAEREIALMKNPATQAQARELEASGAGKSKMDGFRALQAELNGAEESLLSVRTAVKDNATSTTRWSMIIGGLASVAASIAFAWLLSRSVAAPIVAITGVMRRLADGDAQVEVPSRQRQDEVGKMAAAVDVFKRNALERARAEAEAAAERARAEAEREKAAAERAKAAAELASVVKRLGEGLKDIAAGNLEARLNDGFTATYAQLRDDFNEAVDKLKSAIGTVMGAASTIESSAQEVCSSAEDISKRTEAQASSLEETAAALSEVTSTVKRSADGTRHARQVVSEADRDAVESAAVVEKAVGAMSEIARSAQEIGKIIGVIDEIAFQTNLLALNAGVEAARAGEAGKGFAVVASEVRALAQRSAEAAKEIKTLISASDAQVRVGVELVGETGAALKRIASKVTEINTVIGEIASAAQEQSSALQQINSAIDQMSGNTQANAAMAEESTAAGHTLSEESRGLVKLMQQFRVGAPPSGGRAAARKFAA